MTPKVFVIILNWNGKSHLTYNLPSVTQTRYESLEIVLVDNASTDGSVAWVRPHFPNVTVIETGFNWGYAGGNNVGMRYALANHADYVVLLNNDTEVDPRWIEEAVKTAEAHAAVGMIGFGTIGEYRQNEDPNREQFKKAQAEWVPSEMTPADHITGCALFMRGDMLRAIGLLDDIYFAYGEEDDLVNRALRAGYQQVRISVPVWHMNGGSWGKRAYRASYLAIRNNIRFLLKNRTPREIYDQTMWLMRFIVTRHVEFDPDIPHFRRLRAHAYSTNVTILLLAILWNVLNFPVTIWERYKDNQKVTTAQRLLKERVTRPTIP
jgi:GT2 family glycosyltransferase